MSDLVALLKPHVNATGGLISALRSIMIERGYISKLWIPAIAEAFNLSQAEVLGVLAFYEDFKTTKAATHRLRICEAEACQAMGARSLAEMVQSKYGLRPGKTSVDGNLVVERVACLGLCACAPAMEIDGKLYARVNKDLLEARLRDLKRHKIERRVAPASKRSGAVQHVLFLSKDSASVALGADVIAQKVESFCQGAQGGAQLSRTGSRGLYWLEPLLEVDTSNGRVAYGPLSPQLMEAVLHDIMIQSYQHPLCLGLIEELPWLRQQQRLLFNNCGKADPLDFDAYVANGGTAGLNTALELDSQEIINHIENSGLRGRGGAGFPAATKWKTVADCPSQLKYIVCNADEGDSGTFADRMIMEGDPFLLIEGMLIAARAVGAKQGYIYLRSEYPAAAHALTAAIDGAYKRGLLGTNSAVGFELELFIGAGAYICGEETSLLESLESKAGLVRAKPPVPAIEGLFAKPTLIHNVLTLCAVPAILAGGGKSYHAHGNRQSRGSMPFQLSGNVRRGGLVEVDFGITLRTLVEDFGGGTASGRPLGAVQIGGPLGAYLPPKMLDLILDYETLAGYGYSPGHGGIVLFDDTMNPLQQAIYAFEFCAKESCGKCTPCRIGSVRGAETLRVMASRKHTRDRQVDANLVQELCTVMQGASLCAMGSMTPIPVNSLMQYFPAAFAGK